MWEIDKRYFGAAPYFRIFNKFINQLKRYTFSTSPLKFPIKQIFISKLLKYDKLLQGEDGTAWL